ncbi:hypothetical protein SLS62_009653 [Diatrype stigma]|uniref:lytic cellulose monooxygenase (C4-dehydrogenating) n=1 Tax=Diatrype stigma TaxID=117547 RepID=A0AAN9UDD1_9PEZI
MPYPEAPSVSGYGDAEPPMACLGSEYPWPHAHGPLLAYMADCQGPCDQWDGSGKRWFKIWEAGYVATGWPGSGYDGGDGELLYPIASRVAWGHSHLIRRGVNVTIPATLRSGRYLLRYEVINLERRTEFYPECVQLDVEGDGEEAPSEDYLVAFPGAYTLNDPGLAVGGIIYQNKREASEIFNYTMPGPKVWAPDED